MSKEKNGIISISYEEIREILKLPKPKKLLKYASQLINLANMFSQGTRPKVVGQMSDLIKEFKESGGRTFEEWKNWYLKRYPDAIENATEKIYNMLINFKNTLNKINKETVKDWVEDLVLIKTFEGLMLQEAILKKVSEKLGGSYRLATPEEESKGIDGVIIFKNRKISVSIKPKTYISQVRHLPEELQGRLIIYEKKKNGIIIDYADLLQ